MMPSPPHDVRPASGCSLHEWASLRPELLWIYDQPVPNGIANGAGERTRDLSAWLVRSGSASIEADGVSLEAGVGQWLICQGFQVSQVISDDARLLSVRIRIGWPDRRPLLSGGPVFLLDAQRHPGLEKRALSLMKFAAPIQWNAPTKPLRARRISYPAYVRYERSLLAWLDEIFGALEASGIRIQGPEANDPRLVLACNILDRTPLGEALPRALLQSETRLSISQLNRLCRKERGCCLREYRERIRLERACSALEDSSQSVKEIAYDLGFKQLSHFSIWFKKHRAKSPRSFRASVTDHQ